MYRKKILARARGRGISPPAFVALRWPVLWKGRPAGTPEELARLRRGRCVGVCGRNRRKDDCGMENTSRPRGFSGNTLKLSAIAAMFIDHVAWAFVPTESPLALVMHLIGRTTAPIMCFFVAEGYYHTHDLRRYMLRLGGFALLSYVPFLVFEAGGMPGVGNLLQLNVLFTLLLGLCALWVEDHVENGLLRGAALVGLCILSMTADWFCFGIFFVLSFGRNRGDFKRQALWFSLSSLGAMLFLSVPYWEVVRRYGVGNIRWGAFWWAYLCTVGMQAGTLLALPLLKRYNGERGGGPASKWLFYVFYPAHLLVLGILQAILK